MSGLGKVIRAILGVVVVAAIIVMLNGWYGDYKIAARKAALTSKAATATPAATASVTPVTGQKAAILVAGIPMNSNASDGAKTLRVLKKGESLALIGVASNNWLQVKDSSGQVGFIQNASASVKIQK